MVALLIAALCTAGVPSTDPAPDAVRYFLGARVLTVDGPEFDPGYLTVRGSRIEGVGPADELDLPSGADVVDLQGRVVMPGLVCTHSHIGGGWGADSSAPIQPDARILDSIDVRDPGLARARAGGLTTVNVMPGSGHLLSGQTLYLKLRAGGTIDELLLHDDRGRVAGGIKMANGTNSRGEAPFPGTRAKSAALVRREFVRAEEYHAARAGDDPPERDLGLEALGLVLSGERVVHHHTHRHDDILTILRLREEFGFRLVLHHVSDAWKVAEQIAAAGVASSIIVVDSPGGKLEMRDIGLDNGAALERAGARVAIHTDDWITDSRLFLRSGALAVRAGMSRAAALRALTLSGAEMLDLGQRTGSLRPGKDADFVVLDGDPFSVYTQVLETWVEGERVFDRTVPGDRLAAVGGYGAGGRHATGGCCQRGGR